MTKSIIMQFHLEEDTCEPRKPMPSVTIVNIGNERDNEYYMAYDELWDKFPRTSWWKFEEDDHAGGGNNLGSFRNCMDAS